MRGRRGGEWTGEMTSGRIRTRVLHGRQARMWSGLLLAPQCPPHLLFIQLGQCARIVHHTVGTESIQTPLHFSLFVSLQPFAKIEQVHFFFALMYTQQPILTEKNRNVEMFANVLKKKN